MNPNAIKEYWDLAQQYVLADQTFQTQGSGSFTAHQDLIAGGTVVNYGYGGYSNDSVIDNPFVLAVGMRRAARRRDLVDHDESACTCMFKGPFPCFSYATMRDLLDAQSVSWKYYAHAGEGRERRPLERLRRNQSRPL